MPRRPALGIHFTLAAFNLSQDRSLLYAKATTPQAVSRLVLKAIDLGATVISIRRIHLPPEGRPVDPTTLRPTDGP